MTPSAMILAAGLGKRMRPLTDTCPKPLIPVAGKPLLQHVLDRLTHSEISSVTVNSCYLADQVKTFLSDMAPHYEDDFNLSVIEETHPLETGGGVKNALALGKLTGDYSLIINSDLLLQERPDTNSLKKMSDFFDAEKMDVLLLLKPTEEGFGFHDIGDYYQDDTGRLLRRTSKNDKAPFLFIGTFLVNNSCYQDHGIDTFSNLEIFDAAQEKGRLFGCLFDGDVYHVGTVADLEKTEQILAQKP